MNLIGAEYFDGEQERGSLRLPSLRSMDSVRTMSSPLNRYPGQWRTLRGKLDCETETCRRVYGLKLQRITRETECVYCHQSLVDTYAHWLLMSVDHVVPKEAGKNAGISETFLLDYINCVLSCSGCNNFKVTLPEIRQVETEAEFVKLRDEMFAAKYAALIERRAEEIRFYEGRR